MTQTYVIR